MKIDFAQDYFSLFGLEPRFEVDAARLDKVYLELQSAVHPDRFAHLPESERRVSMQWATRVNEAYRTLKRPLLRAQYLLERRGVDLAHESNTAMPHEFLMEQMEWREALAEAGAAEDIDELEALRRRLGEHSKALVGELREALDGREDWPHAADLTRRMMFMEKLQHDIDEALAHLEG